MINELFRQLYRRAQPICFWIVFVQIVFGYWLLWPVLIDQMGPSTTYFNQVVASAVPGPDGRDYIHVGDDFLVKAMASRHKKNGSCTLDVWRVRENIGGKFDGVISLIQFVKEGPFVGEGKVIRTSWPVPPTKIKVDDSWFDDPDAREQVVDVFVIWRYHCNVVDEFVVRWGQNADGKIVDSDARSLHGFKIPQWQPSSHEESEHTRIVLAR